MTEKELAENVARIHGIYVLTKNKQIQMSGRAFGEAYAQILMKAGGYDVEAVTDIELACTHWLEVVWLDDNEQAKWIVSKHIMDI